MRTERAEIFITALSSFGIPDLDENLRRGCWLRQVIEANWRVGGACGAAARHRRRHADYCGRYARRRWFQNVRRADDSRRTRGYTGVALNPQRGTALPSPVVPPKSGAPSSAAMRRVLRRARDGVALNVDEAAIAMTARGDDLADLCASAARVRDAGLTSAGRRGPNGRLPVSYSRKVFIPITHLCRDTCHYCTFVTVPGKLRAQGLGMYMEPDEILDVARRGAELGCKEALFTLGDRPETRWDEARQWLDERGYDSTLDYVRAMAIRVLEETGLLPHLNPGRDDVVGAVAAQAGRPVDGHDAGDHLAAAVRDQGAGPLRQPGQGPRGSAAHAGRRGAAVDSVHHRPAGRHRRDADRARRDACTRSGGPTRSSATSRK